MCHKQKHGKFTKEVALTCKTFHTFHVKAFTLRQRSFFWFLKLILSEWLRTGESQKCDVYFITTQKSFYFSHNDKY